MVRCALLKERELTALTGQDSRSFLQGMISNDIDQLSPSRSIYAAMLTAQGKYLHDFIMVDRSPAVWIDSEEARCDELTERLSLFQLNSDIHIARQGHLLTVAALWGNEAISCLGLEEKVGATKPFGDGLAIVDPRLPSLGSRLIAPAADVEALISSLGIERATSADYDSHRLRLGVPDGSRDMIVDKSFLLESNFEDLNGVAFDKGCYIGQENTARQKHRGTIRKRLVKVSIDGPPPDLGVPITWNKGEIGTMRSSRDGQGIAMIRLDRWAEAKAESAKLHAGPAIVIPVKPEWANF